jgi:hypothetical protein
LALVDGNEDSWIQIDPADAQTRGRMIVSYLDLPELMDQNAVTARAIEEIRLSSRGESPSGEAILFFDLGRMDIVTWIDNHGNEYVVRIEGIEVNINQGKEPRQTMVLDTSLVE